MFCIRVPKCVVLILIELCDLTFYRVIRLQHFFFLCILGDYQFSKSVKAGMNCSFVAPEADFIILKVGSDFLPPAKGFKIRCKWQRTLKAWLCLNLLKQPPCTCEPGQILEHSQIWTLMLLRIWSLEIPETRCRTMQDTNKPKETWPVKCMSHPACVMYLYGWCCRQLGKEVISFL